MDSSDHHRKADELAAKAETYLRRRDGQETAAVWTAVAQVHAILALAAAAGAGSGRQANTAVEPYLEASTRGLISDVTKGGWMPRFPNPT
jgi:hypothetical protein